MFFTGKAYITKTKIDKNDPPKGIVSPQYFLLIPANKLSVIFKDTSLYSEMSLGMSLLLPPKWFLTEMLEIINGWDIIFFFSQVLPDTTLITGHTQRCDSYLKLILFPKYFKFHGTTESTRMGLLFQLASHAINRCEKQASFIKW